MRVGERDRGVLSIAARREDDDRARVGGQDADAARQEAIEVAMVLSTVVGALAAVAIAADGEHDAHPMRRRDRRRACRLEVGRDLAEPRVELHGGVDARQRQDRAREQHRRDANRDDELDQRKCMIGAMRTHVASPARVLRSS